MTAPGGAGHVPGPASDSAAFWAEQAQRELLRNLDDLFRAVLPHQWVQPAIDAVLSDASPLVTPQAHNAAVKRETDWQHHIADKLLAAEIEAGKLRRSLDMSAVERVRAVIRLVDTFRPSRTAKHDSTCYRRHAACLAVKVRDALLGEVEP